MATDIERREQAMAGIYRTLDRARKRWRTLDALSGLLRSFVIVGACLVVGLLADNLLHLPGGVRLAYGLLVAATAAAMLGRLVVHPLVRSVSDEMVAAHLERARPDLDNRVINAVLLSEERFRDPLTRRLASGQIRRTAQSVADGNVAAAEGAGGLWRAGRWALGLAGFLLVYGVLFGGHLGNAFMRFLHPGRYIAPITDTRLAVTPGDVVLLQGDSLAIEARVSGLLPESARIDVRSDPGADATDGMGFEGSSFTAQFHNVQQDFTYRIRAGDAVTRPYQVTVRARPALRDLTLTYRYPPYTGLPERVDRGVTGDISAPVDTQVQLDVTPDRPVAEGRIDVRYAGADEEAKTLDLVQQDAGALRAQLPVDAGGRYAVHLVDADGVANLPTVRQIDAVPDAAPRVVFEQPAKDVAVAPDARVAVLGGAEDDFSLRELHLFVQRRAGETWEKLRSWQYEPGRRNAREGAVLDLQELGLNVGDTLAYYMQANDGFPHPGEDAGRSRVFHVRVADAAVVARQGEEAREALRDVVRRLIRMQSANLEATGALSEWAAAEGDLLDPEQAAWTDFRDRASLLVDSEEAVYAQAAEAAGAYAGGDTATMADALARIAARHVAPAVDALRGLRDAGDGRAVSLRADGAAERQRTIIALLTGLIDNPASVLAGLLKAEGQEEQLSERMDDLADGEQLAERLLKSLDEFADEQRRLILLSNDLAEKPVEDFTDEDEQALKDIIEKEKDWAEFFQEAATDLSKLPPQDHSLATQAKEFLEVYSEIQQAAEEAERKQVELAVPHEQAGAELAESIETNIEKWLMETKDNQLWSMEDPLEDYEVPMTELPEELEDLIGDLVESEEDMEEQFDDMTSAWFDSLDIGAGWDTMDGPISNMSAKGVTGNRLPNTNEIGGRSGEGRTGKSSGQFVEEEATGKGGRQTPSRLTADPFEAGWVKDSSGQAPTGSTGGGKVSGQGAEGFQGPVPPPLKQRMKRMAQQQSDIIDKARRLDYGLKKYRQPRGRLPEAIELMESQQADLAEGELSNFSRHQRVVLSNLREIKELSEKQKQVMRDRSALLPKRLREEIASSQDEAVPEQYRSMVENYFRALAEAGTAQP